MTCATATASGEDVLARRDVELDRVHESGERLRGACAYLELHIEQGPVLESRGEPAATVLGTCGVERHVAVFTGQAAHAGATPWSCAATASRPRPRLRSRSARSARSHEGGVCTVGGATSEPGVVTAVAGRTEMLLDQRHLDSDELAAMLAEAREACEQAATDQSCEVELRHLWSIPPIPFDDRLIDSARAAVQESGGRDTAIPSGPLHDAAEMARLDPDRDDLLILLPAGVAPKEEDTPEADLRVAIEAYGRTVDAALEPGGGGRAHAVRVRALQAQLAYLEAASPFYHDRLYGVREHVSEPGGLPRLPFTTKEELRDGQRAQPPFRPPAVRAARAARAHTRDLGHHREPVAVGFTRADHEANSAVGEAFRIAGVRPDDVIGPASLRALRWRGRRPHGARGQRRDRRAGGHRAVAAPARPDPTARHYGDLRDALVSRLPGRAEARGGIRAA